MPIAALAYGKPVSSGLFVSLPKLSSALEDERSGPRFCAL